MATKSDDKIRMQFVPGEITTREKCFDRIEPLKKHSGNPVMVSDRFWEGPGVYYPCVLYSETEKLFKMWYYTDVPNLEPQASNRPLIDNNEILGRSFLCYARSTDGLHWEKPNLGQFAIKGSKDNNIILSDSGFFMGTVTVIDDPDEKNPARRYKLFMYDNDGKGRDGGRTAVSPDGIHWEFVGEFPMLPTQDTPSMWYDRRRKRYVAFLKDRVENRRARMISTSRDFVNWSAPAVCFGPDNGDTPTMHYYAQNAFHHCGQDFCFLNRYEFATQKLDLELVYSPQGVDWRHFPSRVPILSPGDPGQWDGGMVLCGFGEPIIRDKTGWVYYYGCSVRHDDGSGIGAIGLATFTEGRLVGQQTEGEGWFNSLPFRCPGGRLTLDAAARGPVTVEVWSTGYGGVYPEYTRQECEAVQGDKQDHTIRWKNKSNLDEFRGKFIQLRVYGLNSIVYGAGFDGNV
jgi:hypothetical protein